MVCRRICIFCPFCYYEHLKCWWFLIMEWTHIDVKMVLAIVILYWSSTCMLVYCIHVVIFQAFFYCSELSLGAFIYLKNMLENCQYSCLPAIRILDKGQSIVVIARRFTVVCRWLNCDRWLPEQFTLFIPVNIAPKVLMALFSSWKVLRELMSLWSLKEIHAFRGNY